VTLLTGQLRRGDFSGHAHDYVLDSVVGVLDLTEKTGA